MACRIGVICLLLPWPSPAAAATLPMGGWYRPGRFMPVRLSAGETSVSGDGVAPVDAAAVTREVVVPLWVEGTPAALRCGAAELSVRAVDSAERLVASTGDALEAGRALFPGRVIDPVQLDSADLLPGPAAAWDALDAVVLDVSTMRRVDDSTRSTLLGAGVVLACPGPVPPDLAWPWRREQSRWVLRHTPVGPADGVDGSAYGPTLGWVPRRPAEQRNRIVLSGMLLLVTAVALPVLLPRRAALPGVALLVGVLVPGLVRWRAVAGTYDQAGGDLFVARGDGLLQRDVWVYQRARDDSTITLPWAGDTRPVFDSAAAERGANLKLHVDPAGGLSFTYLLPADHTIAIRRRSILRTLPGPPELGTIASPMEMLAKEGYLEPGLRVVGEFAGAPGRWAGVFIAR